jgi:hypothetical protein
MFCNNKSSHQIFEYMFWKESALILMRKIINIIRLVSWERRSASRRVWVWSWVSCSRVPTTGHVVFFVFISHNDKCLDKKFHSYFTLTHIYLKVILTRCEQQSFVRLPKTQKVSKDLKKILTRCDQQSASQSTMPPSRISARKMRMTADVSTCKLPQFLKRKQSFVRLTETQKVLKVILTRCDQQSASQSTMPPSQFSASSSKANDGRRESY